MSFCRTRGSFDDARTKKLVELAKTKECKVLVWGTKGVVPDFMTNFLTKHGISIDFYSDNNAENKELVGEKYVSLEELSRNRDSLVCFVAVNSFAALSVCEQLLANGIYNIVTYDDIFHVDEYLNEYMPLLETPKIVFYTCIAGGYDNVIEPKFIVPNCDYVLISEKPPSKDSVFKWIDIDSVVPSEISDNHYKNRYCKFFPHLIFPDYKYSVYYDGNVELKVDLTKRIPNLGRTRIALTDRNPFDCVYVELTKYKLNGVISAEKSERICQKYYNDGFPRHFGSFECSVILREHNNPACKKIMEDWWHEVYTFTGRDQFAFPYVLWKNGYKADDVLPIFAGKYCVGKNFAVGGALQYWSGMQKYTHEGSKKKF